MYSKGSLCFAQYNLGLRGPQSKERELKFIPKGRWQTPASPRGAAPLCRLLLLGLEKVTHTVLSCFFLFLFCRSQFFQVGISLWFDIIKRAQSETHLTRRDIKEISAPLFPSDQLCKCHFTGNFAGRHKAASLCKAHSGGFSPGCQPCSSASQSTAFSINQNPGPAETAIQILTWY